jgi:uncharacterized protein
VDLNFDDAAFSGNVPLFPLPGLVLLPCGMLPLHVFEERYRSMTRDAVATEGLIAMALLKPGYEADYHQAPPIEEHVCVGRIAMQREHADGRWDLVLTGVRRARILEEDRSRAYRRARVELLGDVSPSPKDRVPLTQDLRDAMLKAPPALVRDSKRLVTALEVLQSVPDVIPLGMAVDLVADALALAIEDRLALLQTHDVQPRVVALTTLLRYQSQRDQSRKTPGAPPDYSQN